MATITNTCLPHYTITNTWHISYSLRLTLSPRSIWWSVETIERLSSEHSSLSHSPSKYWGVRVHVHSVVFITRRLWLGLTYFANVHLKSDNNRDVIVILIMHAIPGLICKACQLELAGILMLYRCKQVSTFQSLFAFLSFKMIASSSSSALWIPPTGISSPDVYSRGLLSQITGQYTVRYARVPCQ